MHDSGARRLLEEPEGFWGSQGCTGDSFRELVNKGDIKIEVKHVISLRIRVRNPQRPAKERGQKEGLQGHPA